MGRRPDSGSYPVNINLRITREAAADLMQLLAAIQKHNNDPSILRADVLRAIYQRGYDALLAELNAATQAKRK